MPHLQEHQANEQHIEAFQSNRPFVSKKFQELKRHCNFKSGMKLNAMVCT